MTADTPEQKAQFLINQFTQTIFESGNSVSKPMVKDCALIAVDNLIKEHTYKSPIAWNVVRKQFWEEVKKYINEQS